MAERRATRQCPFCREEIRSDAVRCRHCQAEVAPDRPDHEGTCPYCKESINPEAIRCKHCHANLAPVARVAGGAASGCVGSGGGQTRAVAYAGRRSRLPIGTRRANARDPRSWTEQPDAAFDEPRRRADRGCPPVDSDDDGIWCFLESSEHYCIYELCVPATTSPYTVFE
jgi:hypothetical protein